MSIVGAFAVHRRQLTFEYLDTVTGELRHGRVIPADREHLRQWLARFAGHGEVEFALEGCTGWRYVVEELVAAGVRPHLAEPGPGPLGSRACARVRRDQPRLADRSRRDA